MKNKLNPIIFGFEKINFFKKLVREHLFMGNKVYTHIQIYLYDIY